MLLKVNQLKGIRSGTVSLAFRRWEKPRVKVDSLFHSPVGRIQVLDIITCEVSDLTDSQARAAGYNTLDDLLAELNKRSGNLYRIELRWHSEDPRLELRKELTEEDFQLLKKKLEGMDRRSLLGPWTLDTLKLIKKRPRVRAVDLALELKMEKDKFKLQVRKLKNLGLTISLEVGYELSPRGKRYLELIS